MTLVIPRPATETIRPAGGGDIAHGAAETTMRGQKGYPTRFLRGAGQRSLVVTDWLYIAMATLFVTLVTLYIVMVITYLPGSVASVTVMVAIATMLLSTTVFVFG